MSRENVLPGSGYSLVLIDMVEHKTNRRTPGLAAKEAACPGVLLL